MTLCINPKCQRPENSDHTSFCQTCGSELLLDGQYRVSSELGAGGFGKTYVAEFAGGASPKVLKVLINPMAKAVELFKREAEVLSRLNHPGIPQVDANGYFVFFPRNATEPLHCLIMEKIEGLNLQEYMEQRGDRPVNQKLVLQWFIEIVKILQVVHSQNFFHRDIKPSNVMLCTDGRIVLIDFGTAREVTGTYMAKQEARGVTGVISAGYTPVEQLNGQAIQQSDFYALGRTISYLLTAKEPSDIYDPVTDEFPWRDHAPRLHPDFADFLDQMMARIPRDRPPNTQSILTSLDSLNQSIGPQTSGVDLVSQNVQSIPPSSSPPFVAKAPNPEISETPIYSPEVAPPSASLSSGADVPQPLMPPPAGQSAMPEAAPTNPMGQAAYDAAFAGAAYLSQSSLYANFIVRSIAALLDFCFIGVFTVFLSILVGVLAYEFLQEDLSDAIGYTFAYLTIIGVPVMTWLYFALFHSSRGQASLGKRVMGIRLASVNDGQAITFGKATLRFICKLLSVLLLVGYPIALFSSKKQALHDHMTGTLVIRA